MFHSGCWKIYECIKMRLVVCITKTTYVQYLQVVEAERDWRQRKVVAVYFYNTYHTSATGSGLSTHPKLSSTSHWTAADGIASLDPLR